jgi:hypothetical protein
MHASSLLNGSQYVDNSPTPKHGPPASFLHLIDYDGLMHGKDAFVVKLKSIAPTSLLYSPNISSGDVH